MEVLAPAAWQIWLFALVRPWSRKGLRILCYHGVWTTPGYQYGNHLFISVEQFAHRMSWLKNSRYPILRLGEAVHRLADGSLPDYAVVITIDDGWATTYSHMLPILERLGLPATIYVTTWYSDHQLPVINVAADYVLKRAGRPVRDLSEIVAKIVTLPSLDERERALLNLAAELGVTTEEWADSRQFHIMDAEEISDADRRGFDIELHTHRHRSLEQGVDLVHRFQISESMGQAAASI
jgi:peptidoglycan/xylan/chitin deacetylase (PgdA/CDA1 family)